jgi:hypothetical protein
LDELQATVVGELQEGDLYGQWYDRHEIVAGQRAPRYYKTGQTAVCFVEQLVMLEPCMKRIATWDGEEVYKLFREA